MHHPTKQARLRNMLSQGELTAKQIGVVTPYAAQVSLVRQLLGHAGQGIEVNSVDGFQGREKELIIFSAVRPEVCVARW